MTNSTEKDKQLGSTTSSLEVKFDVDEFEKRLAEVRQEFHEELNQSVLYTEPQNKFDVPLNFNIPGADERAPKKEIEVVQATTAQTGLLASLAQEAEQSQQKKHADDQDKQEKSRAVNDALDRVLKFFNPFIQHVNAVEPAISRIYRLDARSVFANLKWQGALVDSRKQSMSDSALLSHVTFSVNFVAPESVLLKRPWGQFDAVKKELQHLKITALDDLDAIRKRPKQEWLETRLDPALPVQILFRGNYELGKIDVMTRNLADFGQTAFRLEPADITSGVLDELGLFLLCRAEVLPPILRTTSN